MRRSASFLAVLTAACAGADREQPQPPVPSFEAVTDMLGSSEACAGKVIVRERTAEQPARASCVTGSPTTIQAVIDEDMATGDVSAIRITWNQRIAPGAEGNGADFLQAVELVERTAALAAPDASGPIIASFFQEHQTAHAEPTLGLLISTTVTPGAGSIAHVLHAKTVHANEG